MIKVSLQTNCHGCGVAESPSREGSAQDLDRSFSFSHFEIEAVSALRNLGWTRDAQGHWFCEDCRADAAEAKAA